MHLSLAILGAVTILSLQSCQRLGLRKPASEKDLIDPKKLEESYAEQVYLENLKYEAAKLQTSLRHTTEESQTFLNSNKLQKILAQIASGESQLKAIDQSIQIEAEDLRTDVPLSQWGKYRKDWRQQKETLVINDPQNYALTNGQITRTFSMDLSGTKNYELGILFQETALTKKMNLPSHFKASIKCDADFKMNRTLFSKSVPGNKDISFKIPLQKKNSPKVVLYLNQTVNECEIHFNDPEKPENNYGVRLVSNLKERNQLAFLKNRFEACVLPDASDLKGVEKLFLTPQFNSMTCVEELTDIQSLEEPIDGLKAKAETLLGQELSEDFLKTMNPNGPLDFSKAPKLNTILISYLVFRHDFYGTLIARLSKWHADHGTQVRILMSDVIANDKDRIMLHGLVESSNNIKVQEFRYNSDGGSLGDHLSEYHRTMHVKLLITLSDNPFDNVVYVGGRNIHDGFVFMTTPDHSAYPELIQYGSGKDKDEGYAPWRDYEMRIRSKPFAEQVASHYLTLWQRDSETFYVRSINKNIVSKTKVDPKYFDRDENSALVRHFISIPYKDDEALEKFYIDIFDSAQKSIRLSTPYFRPNKKLGEAFSRAVARGVEVSLITRIDLSGDTAAIILSEVNKAGINQFLNKIKIYEYTEPGVILHSKIVLVDDKISYIGSVNLNRRSFIHDTENAIMIYNPAYNKKMNEILDVYRKQTREVTEKQKIAFWKKVVIGLLDSEL